MNVMKTMLSDLKYFIILWLSQSLSSLGSAMTNYALSNMVLSAIIILR